MRRGHLGQQPKPHEKLVSSKGDATAWKRTTTSTEQTTALRRKWSRLLIGSVAEQRGDAVGARPASRGRCHCAERRVSRRTGRDTRRAHTAASRSRPRWATATSVSGLLKTNCFQGKRLPLTGLRRVTPTDASAAADTRLALCGPGSRGTRQAAGSLGLCGADGGGCAGSPGPRVLPRRGCFSAVLASLWGG